MSRVTTDLRADAGDPSLVAAWVGLTDIGPNSLDLTPSGGVLRQSSIFGEGWRFNGSDECGLITDTTAVGFGEVSFTYSAWVNVTAAGYVISHYTEAMWITAGGTPGGRVYKRGVGYFTVTSTVDLRDGLDHHVVLVFRNGTGLFIYVDREQVGFTAVTGTIDVGIDGTPRAYVLGYKPGPSDEMIGTSIASSVYLVGKSTAWLLDEYNRAHQALRYYEPQYVAALNRIELGTYGAGEQITGTPWRVQAGAVIVATETINGKLSISARGTDATAVIRLFADGHLNGVTGPVAEGYGEIGVWWRNSGTNNSFISINPTVGTKIRFSVNANTTGGIADVSGSMATFPAGTFPVNEWKKLNLTVINNFADGYKARWLTDGVLTPTDSGSNPTAFTVAVMTCEYIECALGFSRIGLPGFAKHATPRLDA